MSDKPNSVHHITFYGYGGINGPDGYAFDHVSGCSEYGTHCPTRRAVESTLEGLLGIAAAPGKYEIYLSTIDKHLVLGIRV